VLRGIEIFFSLHNNKVERDQIRQENLQSLGINILRFQDMEVRYNLEGVVGRIKLEILRLPPPPLGKEE
jgi:very-short-patch-repair endonuclease